jgi:hypothetical protein
MNWFRRATTASSPATQNKTYLPKVPQEYPAGCAVVTEKGSYFINKDGKRYRIQSDEIFWSWRFPLVVETTEAAVKNYPVAVNRLPFRDGTLLNNIADGKLYLVSEGKLRHIVGNKCLFVLGLDVNQALVVSDADIKIMKQGEPLN